MQLRGCLHDTGANFAPAQVHSSSLSWLCICLHDITEKSHAGATLTGARSPQLLHRSEDFVPARNLATVSCKRGTTTRSGVKSGSRWAGTGSTCELFVINAIFIICIHACILSICGVPSGKHDTNSPSHHINAVSRSHLGVKLAPVRVFSCKHPFIMFSTDDHMRLKEHFNWLVPQTVATGQILHCAMPGNFT